MENSKSSNNLENFVKKYSEQIKYAKNTYDNYKNKIRNTSLPIKISNIIVPFILTYIFTFIYLNIALSIIFAIITSLMIFVLSKFMAIIFQIFYIINLFIVINQKNVTFGLPIKETDIIKSKYPYDCITKSLTVKNNSLAQDLHNGYFTYSFWLYVNNKNSCSKDEVEMNWNNYRYNEWKSIFYRGTAIQNNGDLSSLIQFPGFWLTPVLNNMVIVFQNGSYVERLEIENIPFNTWTNFIVVVETKSVSIYINSKLDRTLNLLQPVTIMNSYDLYLTSDKLTSNKKDKSGFSGFIAELIYYNYSLKMKEINESYNYYKKIIDNYQNKLDSKKNIYNIPGLITNSDYLLK
jgi:hypothetical protein